MLSIHTVPAFSDNYFWLCHRSDDRSAFVVDPGDPEPVERALRELDLTLTDILITHHHSDHTGGASQLAARHGARIHGPASDRIPFIEHTLRDGDTIEVCGTRFTVIAVPGHTLDHIAYHGADDDVVFCGDTLFAGGCGRMFEGEPAQMSASLARLADLPGRTRVFCAHEYTLANLAFARLVEPENTALAERQDQARALRDAGTPTVPTTIELELATNPFLRLDAPDVVAAARARRGGEVPTAGDVFAEIRAWKDVS